MRRVATIVGVTLILLGAALLLQALGVLPGLMFHAKAAGLGWGAWALAFGAGFLVWANGVRFRS